MRLLPALPMRLVWAVGTSSGLQPPNPSLGGVLVLVLHSGQGVTSPSWLLGVGQGSSLFGIWKSGAFIPLSRCTFLPLPVHLLCVTSHKLLCGQGGLQHKSRAALTMCTGHSCRLLILLCQHALPAWLQLSVHWNLLLHYTSTSIQMHSKGCSNNCCVSINIVDVHLSLFIQSLRLASGRT